MCLKLKISLLIIPVLLLTGIASCLAQNKIRAEHLNFTNDIDRDIRFVYADTADNLFLRQLRTGYKLDELTGDCQSDLDKLFRVLNWTSKQWSHSGDNTPSASDALTILREAGEGNRFRCVEYSIVLSSALNSVGLRARITGLKARTVETDKYGAGHVVAEVFIREFDKWIMADAQFNVVPFLEKVPLNGVELQNCLAEGSDIQFRDLNGPVEKIREVIYLSFIPKYLWFFDVSFDNRQGQDVDKLVIDGKTKLMLVPVGAKNPEVFQVTQKIDNCRYTNSTRDFYKDP